MEGFKAAGVPKLLPLLCNPNEAEFFVCLALLSGTPTSNCHLGNPKLTWKKASCQLKKSRTSVFQSIKLSLLCANAEDLAVSKEAKVAVRGGSFPNACDVLAGEHERLDR